VTPAEAQGLYLEWLAVYEHDWVALIEDHFKDYLQDGVLDDFQRDILLDVQRGERRISARSGHGVGKTATESFVICCHALTRFPQKTVCTAPTSSQLFDALASEVKTWLGRLPAFLQQLFIVKSDRIELAAAPQESFIAFNTSRPETPEAMAGVHSEHVLLIGDEASGIPEQVFVAAAGSMSGTHATTLLCGNPVRTSGFFFDTHMKPGVMESWKRYHINCVSSRRVSKDFIDDSRAKWGEDSNNFRVRVLGEFPQADDDTVVPYEVAEAAMARDIVPPPVREIWGLDVARFGSDATALCRRRGPALVGKVIEWRGLDTMQTVGRVRDLFNTLPTHERPEEILIDVIGIGAGVVDRLLELGLPARGINVSESPAMGDRFRNLRAELWWTMRDWFLARACTLSGDEELKAEVVAVKYKFAPNGKIQIESKDDMKRRGLPSPNKADALVLTFAGDASVAQAGETTRRKWSEPLVREIRGIV
jgi:phage terminase large subunit